MPEMFSTLGVWHMVQRLAFGQLSYVHREQRHLLSSVVREEPVGLSGPRNYKSTPFL